MNITNQIRADILVEALPYIQRFYGKTIVVKYGGNAMISEELQTKVMQDVVLMKYIGIRPVIVHGGGPDITEFLSRVGKQSEFVGGLRVTDAETATIAQMVLVGKINTQIVAHLNGLGVRAIGLSGKDANLLKAVKKMGEVDGKPVDIGFVGEVRSVNSRLLSDLIESGYVPVIAPVAVGDSGETFNVNADYVAGAVAGVLEAEKLLMLTNTRGLYRKFGDESSFISSISRTDIEALVSDGTISDGMIPKVQSALYALNSGTHKVSIIDGTQPHSLILELLTDSGIGTEIIE